MQKIFTLILILIANFTLQAQKGRVEGTVTDSKTGETLPGATILIEGTNKASIADFDGKFSINNIAPGKITLVISYISYTTKKIPDVEVKEGDPLVVNVVLEPSSSQDLSEVEVVVTLNKENNTALVLEQKASSNVRDGISAEQIRKSPDRNTSDVLKRVSGVTIQDDKFVVIRGLNERYNASFINNSPLPSTEPDRKAFAFDLFPANMLDNLVIFKTATPDLPAEFAGGLVQVNTRSIPDKNFVSVQIGGGYNTITTFKDKTVYDGGKYDKLGFNDGSRALPDALPGIHEKSTWITNAQQGVMAKQFSNDWAFDQARFMPNSNLQFATGYNFKRKEKDFFGVLFSLSYYSTQSRYTMERKEYEELDVNGKNDGPAPLDLYYTNNVNQTKTATGALLNFSLKLNENNSITLKNLASGLADNKFITMNGSSEYQEVNRILDRTSVRYFSANQIISSQLNSEHFLPKAKIKINFNAGISTVQRSVPNMRFSSYSRFDHFNDFDPSEGPNLLDTVYKANISASPSTGPNYGGFRVYSDLNENLTGSKIDVLKAIKISEKLKIDVKAGAFAQNRTRIFTMRRFGLSQLSGDIDGTFYSFDNSLLLLPENEIFNNNNMGITSLGKGGFKLIEDSKPDDNYTAASRLLAGYGMAELKGSDKWRLIGGLRYESFKQTLEVDYGKFDSVYVNTVVNDLLPSVNAIYNLNEKTAVRLAYYKTLNRPEFRELAAANWYDPETRLSNAGNPNLTRATIQNIDARYEVYPGRGQLITVSGFYKYFENPIERYMFPGNAIQIYYKNANWAKVQGMEFEYRVNLGALLKKDSVPVLNNLTIFSNLSLIKSVVNVEGLDDKVPTTRAMQGQAPYIINGGVSYVDNKNNFSLTAMVNRFGPRIFVVGNNVIPNRWEKPVTVIDFQVSKSFFKNKLELRLNVKDLLHQDYILYYKGTDRKSNKYNADTDYTNLLRNNGSTYSFTLGYKF